MSGTKRSSYLRTIGLLTLNTLIASTAQATYWSPHIGVDLIGWGINANEVIKDQIITDKNPFPRINRAGNIYVGTRVNGFFGMDIGYEQAQRKVNSVVFDGGEHIFARPEAQNNGATIDIKLYDYHFDMSFYWEAVKCLEVIFTMGVAYLHPATNVYHFEYADGSLVEYRNESEVKYSGRFGFGLQYNPTPCFGIKAAIDWDQSRRISFVGFDQNNNFYQISPYKKATRYLIGVVYSLSNPRRGAHRIGFKMVDEVNYPCCGVPFYNLNRQNRCDDDCDENYN